MPSSKGQAVAVIGMLRERKTYGACASVRCNVFFFFFLRTHYVLNRTFKRIVFNYIKEEVGYFIARNA